MNEQRRPGRHGSDPLSPPSLGGDHGDPRRGAGFRYLEHTADLGIESWGPTRCEAIRQALIATASLVIDPGKVPAKICLVTFINAPDPVSGMVRAINDYLFIFDTRGLLLSDVAVDEEAGAPTAPVHLRLRFSGDALAGGTGTYEAAPPPKAATYHGAGLEPDASGRGWVARVILDL